MMPPDYLGELQNPGILEVGDMIIRFYALMIIYMFFNTVIMAGLVWNLLFICRLFGIPWVDGTTKGFVNRRKE